MADKTKMVALRLSPDDLAKLDKRAERLGLSRSGLIRRLINKGQLRGESWLSG